MVRVDLGFDIEPHMAVAGLAHEVDDLFEGRDPRLRHGTLVRKLRGIFAAGPNLADVEFPYLLQREPDKERAWRGDIFAISAAGEIGVETAFMGDDDHTVARHADV